MRQVRAGRLITDLSTEDCYCDDCCSLRDRSTIFYFVKSASVKGYSMYKTELAASICDYSCILGFDIREQDIAWVDSDQGRNKETLLRFI